MLYTEQNFHTICGVSRETIKHLSTYNDLLIKWQKAVNLIAPSTIDNIWHRHFADSAGLYMHLPQHINRIVDVGSGGGFPAIVCAILAKTNNRPLHITMIESDNKKCMFLKECVRILKLNCTVINNRVEKCPAEDWDMMTARALADISSLLKMADSLKVPSALFHKGGKYQQELDDANKVWNIEHQIHPSITENSAKTIEILNYFKK